MFLRSVVVEGATSALASILLFLGSRMNKIVNPMNRSKLGKGFVGSGHKYSRTNSLIFAIQTSLIFAIHTSLIFAIQTSLIFAKETPLIDHIYALRNPVESSEFFSWPSLQLL